MTKTSLPWTLLVTSPSSSKSKKNPEGSLITSHRFEQIDEATQEPKRIYIEQAEQMRTNDRSTLYVDFSHLLSKDTDLAEITLGDYYKHERSLRKGLQDFMFNLFADYARDKLFNLSFHNLPSIERYIDKTFSIF